MSLSVPRTINDQLQTLPQFQIVPEEKPVATTKEEEVAPDTPSETLVSDNKRPLEKEDEDDRENSPNAKLPRIFSPDKVNGLKFKLLIS